MPPGALITLIWRYMLKNDLEVAINNVTAKIKAAQDKYEHAEEFKFKHQLMELEILRQKLIEIPDSKVCEVIDLMAWKANRKKS